ncbi:peptidylprolyl isomerase [Pseudomonas sp. NPDC089554]|uniref:peptidylprolyl isomerase n=1 Tax=Pseudomonas sp. NPDC089554 TaxID=3390653 RepID=UPI003D0446B3
MSRRRLWVGGGALALLGLAIGLALRPGSEPVAASREPQPVVQAATGTVLARLGEQQLSVEELQAALAELPVANAQQLRGDRQALEGWIRSRLAEKALYQQAEAQGWGQRPEIMRQTRVAIEQIILRDYLASVSQVPQDYPGPDALRQAYEAAKPELQLPASYRLSQIFLAVPDAQSVEAVRRQAQLLSKRAQAPGSDFAALAREFSQDGAPGDTGLQPLAQLLPAIRPAVQKLALGEVSEPLRSEAGFHVVKLTEQQPARLATLEEVSPRLRAALRAQRQEQVAKAYVEGLFDLATLSIDGAALRQVSEAKH